MDRWERELKNKVNPMLTSGVEERIEETLNKLPRKRRQRIFLYPAIASIASLFIIFSASLFSPSAADTLKSVPVIGSIFKLVGDISEQKGNKMELTTLLGEEIEVGGHTIIFTESLYDGSTIHIGYLIEPPTIDSKFWNDFFDNLQLTVDGKSLNYGYGMGNKGDFLEDGDYAGVFTIDINREELPDHFMLGIYSRYENRAWKVALPIVLQGENQSFLVNQTKSAKDLVMHYDKITFFPTSTEIAFRIVMDEDVFNSDKYMFMDYQVVDNEGRVLQPLSGGGGGGSDNGQFLQTFKYYFEPLETIPQAITVKPFLNKKDEKELEVVKEKWKGQEMTLSQGDIGQVKILDIDMNDDFATVTIETDGADAYQQANNVWIEFHDTKDYSDDQGLKRVEGTVNQYQLTAELGGRNIEGLYVATSKLHAPTFFEELEMTIELIER
ncbi:DUF4179 domain-containing protein [Oceanobacillus chungangensis]|uniref:DUF4179 domain-containing protein n=1 Tax=Oceanobacillus chungangensis TaxID=1229152 RepID=A0A3D8PWU3_9BACI|nr:DUF4179 domain-containing protein [Oceanobacillus chungangensis]RDW19355.1 hypothetical protein CWR45_07940 [Oceanobacillus chungangensis]